MANKAKGKSNNTNTPTSFDEDDFDLDDKFDQMDQRKLGSDYSYAPPSALDFPPSLEQKFDMMGYKLKWIRIRAGDGSLDTKNVRKRLSPQEGYAFVLPSEVEPEELVMLGDVDGYGGTDIITNGDLVLMKVRREKAEARRAYYQRTTMEQTKAIEDRMRQNQLEGGVKSITRTGKQAHFMS